MLENGVDRLYGVAAAMHVLSDRMLSPGEGFLIKILGKEIQALAEKAEDHEDYGFMLSSTLKTKE